MEYNSQREKLLLPEYGRNIQVMVEKALKIENREERNAAAHTIVSVMSQTNPNYKDVEDYNHKLWDHLFYIANYQLDVDSPYPKPESRAEKSQPKRIAYPGKKIVYKHYGKNLEYFIEKAKTMDDPEMRDRFIEVLVNLMKRHYLTWNRDSVNDDLIKEHLMEISKGEFQFKDSYRLTSTQDILGMQKKLANTLPSTINPAKKKKKKKNFGSGGGSNGGNMNFNNGGRNNNPSNKKY